MGSHSRPNDRQYMDTKKIMEVKIDPGGPLSKVIEGFSQELERIARELPEKTQMTARVPFVAKEVDQDNEYRLPFRVGQFTYVGLQSQTFLEYGEEKLWRLTMNYTSGKTSAFVEPDVRVINAAIDALRTDIGIRSRHTPPIGTTFMFAGFIPPEGYILCDGRAVSRQEYKELFDVIGTTWGGGDGSTTFNLPDLRGRVAVGAGHGNGLSSRVLAEVFGTESYILTPAEIPSHTHGGSTDRAGAHEHPNSEAIESTSGHKHSISTENESHEHDYKLGVRGTGWGSITGVQDSRGDTISFYEPIHITGVDHRHLVTTTADGSHTHDVTISPEESHGHKFTTDGGTGGGQPHGNMPPSLAINYIIKY